MSSFTISATVLALTACFFPATDEHTIDDPNHETVNGRMGDTASTEVKLSNEVREIIRPGCGSCHTSTLPTAKPAALKVFDLVLDDWTGMMTDKQLRSFRSRLQSLDPHSKSKIDAFLGLKLTQQTLHPVQ